MEPSPPTVALAMVGSKDPAWLPASLVRVVRSATEWVVDAVLPSACREVLIPSGAPCVEVAATAADQELARVRWIRSAREGQSVARIHYRSRWNDTVVLRDIRVLRQSLLPYVMLPSVDPSVDDRDVWLEERPLFGRCVAVLRTKEQAGETVSLLRSRGAEAWLMPVVELHDPPDRLLMEVTLRNLARYDWVVFTSTNGVDRTFGELARQGLDTRALGACCVAAIGEATAQRLLAHGVRADVTPAVFQAEALVESVLASLGDARGKRVLLLRAMEARSVLPVSLRAAGVHVDDVPVYRAGMPSNIAMEPFREMLAHGRMDAVMLTSSSTATHLCRGMGDAFAEILSSTCVASIGPVTTATARGLGLDVRVEAREFTLPGLVRALEDHFR